jgi:putative redox protein
MTEEKATNLWKEIKTEWDGNEGYLATNAVGGKVLMGKDAEGNPGINPMEMLLAGLAGCTAMDIIDILKKKRQVPTQFQVKVSGNQKVDDYPKVFVEFKIEYLLWGDDLKDKDVAQAIQLSEEKYCSVGGTLSKAGQIHSTFRILKPDQRVE